MKNIIVITGHGNYASGMKSMIEMVSGPNENIHYIDFLGNDTDETLSKKYKEIINKDICALFACDLLGGSPYKETAKLAFANKNIKVVAGCNAGALIDTAFKMNNLSIEQLADNLIESSKKNLFILDTNTKSDDLPSNGEGI